jgi:hypothetical protein
MFNLRFSVPNSVKYSVSSRPGLKPVNVSRGFGQTDFYRRLSSRRMQNGYAGNGDSQSNNEPQKKREDFIPYHAGPYSAKPIQIHGDIEADELKNFLIGIWDLAEIGNKTNASRILPLLVQASKIASKWGYLSVREIRANSAGKLIIRVEHKYKDEVIRRARIAASSSYIPEWLGFSNGACPKFGSAARKPPVGPVKEQKDDGQVPIEPETDALAQAYLAGIFSTEYIPERYSLESMITHRIR